MSPVKQPAKWILPVGVVIVLAVAVSMIPLVGGEAPDDSVELASPEEQPPPKVETATPTPPSPVQPDSTVITQPTVQPEAAPAQVEAAVTTLTRWTANWVNVRADRNPDAEILRVLTPGQRVEVADLAHGWWAVYLQGEMIGFVANSLILDQPPGSEPDTGVPAFRLP